MFPSPPVPRVYLSCQACPPSLHPLIFSLPFSYLPGSSVFCIPFSHADRISPRHMFKPTQLWLLFLSRKSKLEQVFITTLAQSWWFKSQVSFLYLQYCCFTSGSSCLIFIAKQKAAVFDFIKKVYFALITWYKIVEKWQIQKLRNFQKV